MSKPIQDAEAAKLKAIGEAVTRGVLTALGREIIIVSVGIYALAMLWNALDIGLDSSDRDGFHRSNASVTTDYGTGLQYLRTNGGGITPRLGADGKQMRKIGG